MTLAGNDNTTTPSYRGLKAVVIILGALILLAFGALVAGLLLLGNGGRPRAAENQPYALRVPAPAGAQIAAATMQGDRLLLRIESTSGTELAVIDSRNGRVLGRIALTQAAP